MLAKHQHWEPFAGYRHADYGSSNHGGIFDFGNAVEDLDADELNRDTRHSNFNLDTFRALLSPPTSLFASGATH